jgi:hypothetical protein
MNMNYDGTSAGMHVTYSQHIVLCSPFMNVNTELDAVIFFFDCFMLAHSCTNAPPCRYKVNADFDVL